jgi:1-deoxy-D-xylulose-5-phosphate reductoisomerase
MKSDILRAVMNRAPAERTVTILGATGSIGASTVDLLKRERNRFRIEALSANKNAAALAAIARELGARFAAIGDPTAYRDLKSALSGTGIKVAAGESGLLEAAERPAEWVIGAITGAAGLKPTLAAAERGAIVALANKETLVCAGALFMRRAAAAGATVLPVDSEHNALFQAMSGSRREDVRRVILTAYCQGCADGYRRAGAQAPQLVDGGEGHDRFGDFDEQRAGTH